MLFILVDGLLFCFVDSLLQNIMNAYQIRSRLAHSRRR